MGIARRQKRAFERAYKKHQDKMILKHRMTPIYTNPFEGLPVGESFIQEYDKAIKQIQEDYEVTTSSK